MNNILQFPRKIWLTSCKMEMFLLLEIGEDHCKVRLEAIELVKSWGQIWTQNACNVLTTEPSALFSIGDNSYRQQ